MTKYENQCDHSPEDFYDTVELFGRAGDLYFYIDRWKAWNYCFRSGPDGDYESGEMHSRPYDYGRGIDIVKYTNQRFELWGYFAKFLIRKGQLGGIVHSTYTKRMTTGNKNQ